MKNKDFRFISFLLSTLLFLYACDDDSNLILEDDTNLNCAILTEYSNNGDTKNIFIRNNFGRLDTLIIIHENHDSLNTIISWTYDSNNKILNTLINSYLDTTFVQFNYSQNKLERTHFNFQDSVKINKYYKEVIKFNSNRYIEKYDSYEIINNTMYQDKTEIYNYDNKSNLKSKEIYSKGNLSMILHYSDYDSSMYYLLNSTNDYFNLKTFTKNPKTVIKQSASLQNFDTTYHYYKYNEYGYLINMTLDTNNWPKENLYYYYCW